MAPLSRPSDSSGSCSHTNCRGRVPGASTRDVKPAQQWTCRASRSAVEPAQQYMRVHTNRWPGPSQAGGSAEAAVRGTRSWLNSRRCDRTGVMLRRYRRSPPGAQYPPPRARCAAPPRHSACWTAGCGGQGGTQPEGGFKEGHGPPPARKGRRSTHKQAWAGRRNAASAPMLCHRHPLQACSSRIHDACRLNVDALVTLQAARWGGTQATNGTSERQRKRARATIPAGGPTPPPRLY